MKTRTILMMSAVAALVIAAFSLSSCSKEEMSGQTSEKTNQPHMTVEEQAVFNSIVNFREEIAYINEHPGYKSVGNLAVDSAVWYLDATLNLSHAFISWEPMNNFYYDSVFINIAKSADTVSYDNLAAAYAELKQKVADVCIAAPGNDKELYIASLTQKSDNGSSITLKVDATIGSKTTPPGNENPFEFGWYYGDKLGDEYGNQIDISDACLQLRDATNYYRSLYIDDDKMFYIGVAGEDPFVIISSLNDYFINPDDPTGPGDNYYDRLLEYQEQGNTYHYIIDSDEINFYYHALHTVIYDMVPGDPEEWPNAGAKTFIQILEDDLNTFGIKDNALLRIYHQFKIEYRIGIFVGNSSEPTSIVN